MIIENSTWLALILAVLVALFLGVILWRHKEPPAGAFIAFAGFCALPILVLSGPELLPKLVGYCGVVKGEQYCLSELVHDVQEANKNAKNAEATATSTKAAVVNSIPATPPVIDLSGASPDSTKFDCKPYIYPRGVSPSAATLLIGQGKSNWFPVVASIYSKEEALKNATSLSLKSKYPVHVYQAKDGNGKPVWAVTLEGHITQDQAKDRVCYAQEIGIAKDAYAWASDKWSENIIP